MLRWLDSWSSRIKGLEHAGFFFFLFLLIFDEWGVKRCKLFFFLMFSRRFSLTIQVPGCNMIISFHILFYIYILFAYILSLQKNDLKDFFTTSKISRAYKQYAGCQEQYFFRAFLFLLFLLPGDSRFYYHHFL